MPRRVISAKTAKAMASRASDGTPRSSDCRIGMGAISAAIRSIRAGFFTPPPAATTSSIGGPSWAHCAKPQRNRSCGELGKSGHQVHVVATMSLGSLGDEGVAVHLESGRFRRTACQKEILFQQFGEERLVDSSCPGESPILITCELTAGEMACQTVERRIGWSGVEPENTRWIIIEHREIGDPAEIENRPSAWFLRLSGQRTGWYRRRRERCTFAAGGDVASTEVGNDIPPCPYCNDIAVPELKRRPACTRNAAVMINCLAVRADKVHLRTARPMLP